MQAIVVDSQPVVNEQPAPIIGLQGQAVDTRPMNNQETCPTHCEALVLAEAIPPSASISVVDAVHTPHCVWAASANIEASDTFAKIENLFFDTLAQPAPRNKHAGWRWWWWLAFPRLWHDWLAIVGARPIIAIPIIELDIVLRTMRGPPKVQEAIGSVITIWLVVPRTPEPPWRAIRSPP
jgi:hypothetical protein